MSGAFLRTALLIRSARARGFALGDYGVPRRLARGERGHGGRRAFLVEAPTAAELLKLFAEDEADPRTRRDAWDAPPGKAA